MKNSRLELRAISEFNFMLRFWAGFSKSKGVKKEEGSGSWEMGDREKMMCYLQYVLVAGCGLWW